MVLRSALGALASVAIIGAVAAALPERKSSTAASKDLFGRLAKQEFAPADKARQGVPVGAAFEGSSLFKLASYPTTQQRRQPKQIASAAVPSDVYGPAPVADTGAQPMRGVPAPTGDIQPAPPGTVSSSVTAEPGPKQQTQQVAVARPVAPPSPASENDQKQPAAPEPRYRVRPGIPININRASVEVLDHLPGAGHIGRAIANRRPYRSVEDLLHKRVLREGAFQRIRPMISVN